MDNLPYHVEFLGVLRLLPWQYNNKRVHGAELTYLHYPGCDSRGKRALPLYYLKSPLLLYYLKSPLHTYTTPDVILEVRELYLYTT